MIILNALSSFCSYKGHLNVMCCVALRGHILNMPCNSRMKRIQIRGLATQKAVPVYLDRYAHIYGYLEESSRPDTAKEYLFDIWFQGEDSYPDSIKSCWRGIRNHSDLELIVLDENKILDWIELQDFVVNKWRDGRICPAHFADICRIELLYSYGCLWKDLTKMSLYFAALLGRYDTFLLFDHIPHMMICSVLKDYLTMHPEEPCYLLAQKLGKAVIRSGKWNYLYPRKKKNYLNEKIRHIDSYPNTKFLCINSLYDAETDGVSKVLLWLEKPFWLLAS